MNSLKKIDFIKKLRDSSEKKYDRMFTERSEFNEMNLQVDENINEVNKSIKREILESIVKTNPTDNVVDITVSDNNMKPIHQIDMILSQNFQDIIPDTGVIIYMCCFGIYQKYVNSTPFLSYVLCSGTISNEDVYTFPYKKVVTNEKNLNLQQYTNVSLDDIIGFKNVNPIGYLETNLNDKTIYYVFYDVKNLIQEVSLLKSENNDWIFSLASDIVYGKKIFERNIFEGVRDLFNDEPLLSIVFDGNKKSDTIDELEDGYHLPITVYKIGEDIYDTKKNTGYGPYYTFYGNYQDALMDTDSEMDSRNLISRVFITFSENIVSPVSTFVSSSDDNEEYNQNDNGDDERSVNRVTANKWYLNGDILFYKDRIIVKREDDIILVDERIKLSEPINNSE